MGEEPHAIDGEGVGSGVGRYVGRGVGARVVGTGVGRYVGRGVGIGVGAGVGIGVGVCEGWGETVGKAETVGDGVGRADVVGVGVGCSYTWLPMAQKCSTSKPSPVNASPSCASATANLSATHTCDAGDIAKDSLENGCQRGAKTTDDDEAVTYSQLTSDWIRALHPSHCVAIS